MNDKNIPEFIRKELSIKFRSEFKNPTVIFSCLTFGSTKQKLDDLSLCNSSSCRRCSQVISKFLLSDEAGQFNFKLDDHTKL